MKKENEEIVHGLLFGAFLGVFILLARALAVIGVFVLFALLLSIVRRYTRNAEIVSFVSILLALTLAGLSAWFAFAKLPAWMAKMISKDAFVELCMRGTLQEMEDAIKAGADVNARHRDGVTTLMLAAYNRNPEVTIALIEAGADIDAKDENGWTALMRAALMNSNPEIIIALIKNGANVKLKDEYGQMAIDIAKNNKELKNTYAFRELNDLSH